MLTHAFQTQLYLGTVYPIRFAFRIWPVGHPNLGSWYLFTTLDGEGSPAAINWPLQQNPEPAWPDNSQPNVVPYLLAPAGFAGPAEFDDVGSPNDPVRIAYITIQVHTNYRYQAVIDGGGPGWWPWLELVGPGVKLASSKLVGLTDQTDSVTLGFNINGADHGPIDFRMGRVIPAFWA
jgi:hypothetical protein